MNKATQGLKQAPRAWFESLQSALLQLGLLQVNVILLFLYIVESQKLNSGFYPYVDDIIVTGSSSVLVQQITSQLNSMFSLKQLHKVDYLLRIEVKHLPSGQLILTQHIMFYSVRKIC